MRGISLQQPLKLFCFCRASLVSLTLLHSAEEIQRAQLFFDMLVNSALAGEAVFMVLLGIVSGLFDRRIDREIRVKWTWAQALKSKSGLVWFEFWCKGRFLECRAAHWAKQRRCRAGGVVRVGPWR